MTNKFVLPAALLLALGSTTALSVPGFAQAPAAPAQSAPSEATPAPDQNSGTARQQGNAQRPGPQRRMQGQRDHRLDFTARAEARIAYIKAELKITPAQQSAFDKYAQAIRNNAATTQKTFEAMRGQRGQDQNQSVSAIDRVEQRAKMAQMHDQQQQQYLAAFRPLYASLSSDQKKVADDLAAPHFRHFGRDRGGPPPRRG